MSAENDSWVSATSKDDSPVVLPLIENGKSTGQWSLTLHPAHLALADAPGAQPYIFFREEFIKAVTFMEGARLLSVPRPRKIIFKLTPEGTAALIDWLGKPFLAALSLKRRYAWVLPWAVVWVLGTLSAFIPAPAGSPEIKFDAYSFVMGTILLVSCGLAKWRPHPLLFLVDSLWFASVGLNTGISVFYLGWNPAWLLLVLVTLMLAVSGFRQYFRFRGVKIIRLPKAATTIAVAS